MTQTADIRAEAKRIQSVFVAAGAAPLEAELLQPADTLLDLYGEDIRARAYVTQDPLRGERMLRPDFTVPVVQMHMAHGAEPARYTYSGEVFRRQETDLQHNRGASAHGRGRDRAHRVDAHRRRHGQNKAPRHGNARAPRHAPGAHHDHDHDRGPVRG